MKKRIILFVLAIILIMISAITVNAADAVASLNLSSEEVKIGDTFTVTLNVVCEEGINGLEGILSYDTSNLELVKTEMVETSKWVNLGDEVNFSIIHNSSNTETSADIVKATFKVKDTAVVGTTAKITMSNIKVDSDAATNSTKTIGTKETEVSIVEQQPIPETPTEKTLTGISITKAPTKTTYTEGESFDKTGMIVKATYSDGSSKEITAYTVTDGSKLTSGKTNVTISYTENGVTKTTAQEITVTKASDGNQQSGNNKTNTGDNKQNSTKSDNKIPYTGVQSTVSIIAVASVLAVVSFIGYKKYKDI